MKVSSKAGVHRTTAGREAGTSGSVAAKTAREAHGRAEGVVMGSCKPGTMTGPCMGMSQYTLVFAWAQ